MVEVADAERAEILEAEMAEMAEMATVCRSEVEVTVATAEVVEACSTA